MPNYKDEQQPLQRKMIISGHGLVSVAPDQASVRLGVQTNAESVTVAQDENARISQEVIMSLKALDINEIQTVQYQVEQVYDYQNGERIDRGYQVRNILDVKTDQIELVGTIIDTAVNSGANIVESVNFEVSNQSVYYQQALNLAVKDAMIKAKSIASHLKGAYEPIPILITENSLGPIPYKRGNALGEIAFATPIEPGTNDIQAAVTVEFIY